MVLINFYYFAVTSIRYHRSLKQLIYINTVWTEGVNIVL